MSLFDRVQETLKNNKKFSRRNNRTPEETLLRGGLAKCGYCNGTMEVNHFPYKWKDGVTERVRVRYRCRNFNARFLKCLTGCSIDARIVDQAAVEYLVEIIKDPSQVDQEIEKRRAADSTLERRKSIQNKLAELRREQANMEENLARLMRKGMLNPKTEERLTTSLNDLALQEEGYLSELTKDEDLHEKWKKAQEKLDELHKVCAEMRKNLDDPEYILPYEKKRELCEFFHIQAIIYREDHTPRFEINCDPDGILSDLS